ncbi:MAG: Error-prone DNA polymerase [Mycoplasmataceae bacterium]|nr:MAG: Error-prone DNA polymerase [Mycoplasmataceae bacterium]
MDQLNYITHLNVQTNCNLSFSLISTKDLLAFALEKNLKFLSISDYQPYDFINFYYLCKANKIKPIWCLKRLFKFDENNSLVINFFPRTYPDYRYLNKIIYKNNDFIEIETLRDLSFKCLLVLESRSENDFIFVSDLKKNLDSHLENIYLSNTYIGVNFFSKNIEDLNSKLNLLNIIPFFSVKTFIKEDEGFLNILKKTSLSGSFSKEDLSSNWISYLSFEDFLNHVKLNSKKSDHHFQENFYFWLFSQLNDFINKIDLVIKTQRNLEKDEVFFALETECRNSLSFLLLDKKEEEKIKYEEVLSKELVVIKKFKYSNYFLILKNIMNSLVAAGLEIGPGRGSAVSSLVSYLLNITKVDPIKHDLFFWRFLNEKREDYPDIDTDIDDQEQALNIIQSNFGKNHVAKIITRKKIGWSSAVKASLKIFKINDQDSTFIEENIDAFSEKKPSSWKVKHILEKYFSMFEFIEKIYNLNFGFSTHASGLIISDKNLSFNIPVKEDKNFLISLYKKECLGNLGFIKYDFLGLTESLGFIKSIRKNFDIPDYKDLNLNDEKTWNILKKGLLVGVFQVDTRFFREIFSKLKPDNFQDLILILALNRPGANKNVEDILRKRTIKNYSKRNLFSSDLLNEILSSTYGNIIFEEQVSHIFSCCLKIDFSDAELLRKKLKKIINDEKEVEKFKIYFFENSFDVLSDYEKDFLWEKILHSAPYMFNKAHTTAYAYLTYYTAYLKANFSKDSMLVLLNKYSNNSEKTKNIFQEIISLDYQIMIPEINHSDLDWTFNGDSKLFVMGFDQLKIHNSFFESVVKDRNTNGSFKNWKDLIERNINSFEKIKEEELINLIKLGLFRSICVNSVWIIKNLNFIRRYIKIKKSINFSNNENLPFLKINDSKESVKKKQEEIFDINSRELEAFNFYFTYFERWKLVNENKEFDINFFTDWIFKQNLSYEDKKINIYSVIFDIRKVKKGYLIKLQDLNSFIEVFISDNLYDQNAEKILINNELLFTISGKLKSYDYQYFKIESIKENVLC